MGNYIFQSRSQGWVALHSPAIAKVVCWAVFPLTFIHQNKQLLIYIYIYLTLHHFFTSEALSHSRCDTEDCGASFQTPSALRKHQKTHRGRATDLTPAIKKDILGGVTLSRDPLHCFPLLRICGSLISALFALNLDGFTGSSQIKTSGPQHSVDMFEVNT